MLKITLVALLLAACGDNIRSATPDAGPDAPLDGGPERDVETDGVDPTPDVPGCVDPHTGKGKGHVKHCHR